MIPAKVIFEWIGKDGSKRSAVITNVERRLYSISSHTGCIHFSYVPLPRNKKIEYTLHFESGTYVKEEDRDLPLLYYYNVDTKTRENKTELLDTHPEFWKAKFMVVEAKRKGAVIRHQKPAED